MDISIDSILRGRSNLPSKPNSKSSLVFSSTSSISYYKHIKIDNNKPEEDIRELVNSSQLSYKDDTSKDKSVSYPTDISPTDRTQCVSNEALALNNTSQTQGKTNNNNRSNSSQQATFNIQLLYDVDQEMD